MANPVQIPRHTGRGQLSSDFRGRLQRFIKWDEDRSRAAIEAPRDLLQTLRDELGRLNRYEGEGADLYLGVTVLRFRPAGFFKRSAADLELVARDGYGRMMWAATGPVEANRDLAESLADTDSVLIAREALRKVRAEIRRSMTRPPVLAAPK